jgi:hypothetical protein
LNTTKPTFYRYFPAAVVASAILGVCTVASSFYSVSRNNRVQTLEARVERARAEQETARAELTKAKAIIEKQSKALPDREAMSLTEKQLAKVKADLTQTQLELVQARKERDNAIAESRRLLNLRTTSLSTVDTQTPLSGPANSSSPATYLADLQASDYNGNYSRSSSTLCAIGGTVQSEKCTFWDLSSRYDSYLLGSAYYAEYVISKQFESLSGTIGLLDTSGPYAKVKVTIIGDGTRLATYNLEYGTPQNLKALNVRGVLLLRIEIVILDPGRNGRNFFPALLDAKLDTSA